ncbi:MAG: uracil-DNA glycosylase family protein [Bacteroidales bacterium]|nr:uracil-DNA glycosylase family protein [Bacteroidales bacterium]
MDFSKDLFKLYQDLIEKIYNDKDLYVEDELNVWPSRIGKDYNNELMIVGRAGNGGKIYIDKNEDKYRDSSIIETKEQLIDGLQWVIDLWGNNEFNIKYSTKYNTKKSAFWRLSKRLSNKLTSDNNDSAIHKIVYSNLYKVSKESGGNPSTRLMNVQFDICRSILIKEIELFKPQIIVFLTGWSFAQLFLSDLKTKVIEDGFQYVESVGKVDNSLIVVSKHPQGKPEDKQFEEILSAIYTYLIN